MAALSLYSLKNSVNILVQRYNSFLKGIILQVQLKIYTSFEDIWANLTRVEQR
jgi:hypothetical protein